MTARIDAPPISTIKETAEFLRTLFSLVGHPKIIIDVQKWRFARPFNMLLIGHYITYFRSISPQSEISFENFHPASYGYLSHIRLVDYLNGNHSELIQPRQNDNYMAITRVPIKNIQANSAKNAEEIAETITDYAGMLVDLLLRGKEKSLDSMKILRFSIREIIRNVFEHSQAKAFYVTGQYWPTQRRIQVALSDPGVGIKRSISKNENLRVDSDRDALHLALLPGISGSPNKLHEGNLNEAWRNSGFGLFMASRFCRKSGGFTINSGECCLILDENKTTYQVPYAPGTIIRLDLLERDLRDADSTLRKLVREGEALQKDLYDLPFLTASRASRMLSVEPLMEEVRATRKARLTFTQDEDDLF